MIERDFIRLYHIQYLIKKYRKYQFAILKSNHCLLFIFTLSFLLHIISAIMNNYIHKFAIFIKDS